MKICAVIPTFNRKNDVAACVQALLVQTRPLDEIIVVDNASDDGTGALIAERFAGQVSYVQLPENIGGAGGFHEGMKRAFQHGHDWIWCLDSDALPLPDTLQKQCEARSPSGVPVVAKTCPTRDPITGERHPTGDTFDFRHGRELRYDAPGWEERVCPIDSAYFRCLLVKADAACRAGFGDPEVFLYYDDLLFSLALRKLGQILHVGTTSVVHAAVPCQLTEREGRRRVSVVDYWKLYYLIRNSYVFRRRCFGIWKAILPHTVSYVRMMVGVCLFDDFKRCRLKILTKAFLDGLFGRLGKRVDPETFRKGFRSDFDLALSSSTGRAQTG